MSRTPSDTSQTSDASLASLAFQSSGTSDVLVVGGGIIGLVTAWRAAQRGFTTALLDPEPGGGAAQVAAGMLAAVTELHYGEQTLLGLNLASADRYPDFVAELTEATGPRPRLPPVRHPGRRTRRRRPRPPA